LRQRFQEGFGAGGIGEFQEQDRQEFARVRLDDIGLQLVEHDGGVADGILPRDRLCPVERHGFSSTGLVGLGCERGMRNLFRPTIELRMSCNVSQV
jgi:hypothetical protein